MSESKPGWTRVRFGEVVRLSKERCANPLAAGIERFIGLEHLEPGDLRIRSWGNVKDGTTFTTRVRPGNVLFGKRRAYLRKVAVAEFDAVCSGDIYVFESRDPKRLLPDLLPFLCQTEAFFDHAIGTSAGSLSPRTNWSSLANYEFVLPQKEEQKQAVRTLSVFDSFIRNLEATRLVINNVIKSLLNSMFPSEIMGIETISFSDLLREKHLTLQTGPFGTVLPASKYSSQGWPVVNPTDIKDGKIAHQGKPCVSDKVAGSLEKYRMRPGDILLARKGEIEKACIATSENEGWIIGSDCIRLRIEVNIFRPEYLLKFIQSPSTGLRLRSLAHGTVMLGLNEKTLKSLSLPLIPITRQDELSEYLASIEGSRIQLDMRLEQIRLLRRLTLDTVFNSRG